MQNRTLGPSPRANVLGLFFAICSLTCSADEATMAAEVAKVEEGTLSEKGADTCLECHRYWKYPILPIFKTKHAVASDPRTPFAGLQCEACHGPGHDHATKLGKIIGFGKDSWVPVHDQNRKCLECHQGHARIGWSGSTHERNDVACVDCHSVHVASDPVLDRRDQPNVCYACHLRQRAQFYQASYHPVRHGKMDCSGCHNAHGSNTQALLKRPTLNETCYTCHADKRGPYLWEHPPVTENCTLCHRPHGSNLAALLKRRPPLLCQECHSQAGHPSVQYDGSTVLPQGASPFVLVKGCLNCHYQVHGSNHPSGVKLMR